MPRCCMKIRKNDFFDFPNLNLVGLTPWSVWVAVGTKSRYRIPILTAADEFHLSRWGFLQPRLIGSKRPAGHITGA